MEEKIHSESLCKALVSVAFAHVLCLLQAMERQVQHFQTFLWWKEGFQRETRSSILIHEGESSVLRRALNAAGVRTSLSTVGKKVQTIETKAILVLIFSGTWTEPVYRTKHKNSIWYLFLFPFFVNSHTHAIADDRSWCYWVLLFFRLLLLVLINEKRNTQTGENKRLCDVTVQPQPHWKQTHTHSDGDSHQQGQNCIRIVWHEQDVEWKQTKSHPPLSCDLTTCQHWDYQRFVPTMIKNKTNTIL